jgi:ATP-dependent DNA helicase RecG
LQKVFHRYKVGLLHGRMKASEKDEIMAAFRDQQFDVLVTTSVAEVGVDIPNASLILIESANRFGLAQLHQFRGRVGRGGHPSYCFLMSDLPIDEAHRALQRLKREGKGAFDLIKEMPNDPPVRLLALEETSDGFKLAEMDWVLRGPGDLIGTRQSGQSAFKLMENMSPELVELAQREARTIFEEDPELTHPQHRLLAQRVAMYRDERSDLS